MEDSGLRRSRRLLGLPPVILEPPLPPLRRRLDQQGSFEATGFQTIEPNNSRRNQPPILVRLKPQPLILGRKLLCQFNFTKACQCLTQLWQQTLLLLRGILPFPLPLSPQEKHLLTCHRRSEPPRS
jgi:hypothetical protein